MEKIYYFDNAATSFPKPEKVAASVFNYIKNFAANPGRSSHKLSIESARFVFETRENIAELLNINNSENIIFTQNATESLNIVIKGYLKENYHILTSFTEHNSVLRPLNSIRNITIDRIKFSKNTGIDFSDFHKKLSEKKPDLVIINHASNVTGKIVNLDRILELKEKFKFKLLIDAAQTGGIFQYDLKNQDIDFIAFTGHKGFYGPQGIGFLFIKNPEDLIPLKQGGTGSNSENDYQPDFLPDKFESGTLNVPGIVGLNAGIEFIKSNGIKNIYNHKLNLINYFFEKLKTISNKVILYSKAKNNSGVISLNIKNLSPSKVSFILDKEFNIATRPGLHCAPLIHKALNTYPYGTVRFSIGYFNTKEEIDYCIEALKFIIKKEK